MLALSLLVGCSTTEVPPAPGGPTTVDAVNADASLVGKSVSVGGYYWGTTKVADPPSIHVPVYADAGGKAGRVVCVTDTGREFELGLLEVGTEVVATGTVSAEKIDGGARLDGCVAVPGGPEAPEGKAGKGKGGKAGKNKGGR